VSHHARVFFFFLLKIPLNFIKELKEPSFRRIVYTCSSGNINPEKMLG
jgi:hypothetical protein